MEQDDLAGLICAPLCHDLGSPVGAVVNGVDLLREVGGAEGEELDMLERSALRAAALLRFHRIAFGAVCDPEATLPRAELAGRAEEVLGGPRVEVVCAAPDGPPVSAHAAKLAALMLLAGRSALGMRGTLRLLLPAEGALPVAVMAEGAAAGLSEDQQRWLQAGGGSSRSRARASWRCAPFPSDRRRGGPAAGTGQHGQKRRIRSRLLRPACGADQGRRHAGSRAAVSATPSPARWTATAPRRASAASPR